MMVKPEHTIDWSLDAETIGRRYTRMAEENEALRTDNATLRTALQNHGEEAARMVENRAAIAELVWALQSAVNQVEYMHRKFNETGSGNGFISQWTHILTKHDPRP